MDKNPEEKEYTLRNCVFGFNCSSNWELMKFIDISTCGGEIKFCNSCQKEVYECIDDDELIQNIKLNRCVSISRYENNEEIRLSGVIDFKK